MSSPEQRNKLADLLQEIVDGTLPPEAALKVAGTWTDMPWKEREVNGPWHTLVHFQIDEDIRERDPGYDAGLREQLLRHIAKLKSKDGWPG